MHNTNAMLFAQIHSGRISWCFEKYLFQETMSRYFRPFKDLTYLFESPQIPN